MGLYKRGQYYWMTFSFNGKQYRRSTGTGDKALARDILSSVRVKMVEGRFFDLPWSENHTFAEMMGKYMEEKSAFKSPTTHRRDKTSLRNLLPMFGNLNVREITPKIINQFKLMRRGNKIAPSTINKDLGLLRHVLNVACNEWDWPIDNPFKKIKMEPVHNEIERWLTADEEIRLLSASPLWLKELIIFALNTGMRMGEILQLRWNDVDLARRILVVMKSKNGEKRTLPLNRTVIELLTEKRARIRHGEFVFSTSRGTEYIPKNLTRSFILAREKAELGRFRFHDLRHSFATRLVQKGVDLYKVQKLLGHKSPKMTQRYSHHCADTLRDGVEILDPPVKVSHFYHNEGMPERKNFVSD